MGLEGGALLSRSRVGARGEGEQCGTHPCTRDGTDLQWVICSQNIKVVEKNTRKLRRMLKFTLSVLFVPKQNLLFYTPNLDGNKFIN